MSSADFRPGHGNPIGREEAGEGVPGTPFTKIFPGGRSAIAWLGSGRADRQALRSTACGMAGAARTVTQPSVFAPGSERHGRMDT
jgi:hypothetical protein